MSLRVEGMYFSRKKHDVFLSFRGEDTRKNFTSHLNKALTDNSIKTFTDEQLKRGEDVRTALMKAIQESDMAIIVFSKNYANSTWCLEELWKILECRKMQGQVVIPVFYRVDPSHIRKQSGSFKMAFAKHERDPGLGARLGLRSGPVVPTYEANYDKDKVSKWKIALTEAANLSGWDTRSFRDESQMIENIVKDIEQKRQQKYPNEQKDLVNEENGKKVKSLLETNQVVGIWGVPGIGKTTIAKNLFAKAFPRYDYVCFVANAKEYSPEMLLSELLREDVSTSNDVYVSNRLSGKSVLIVLEDVDMDSIGLLKKVYKYVTSPDIGPKSRLLVTARTKHWLDGIVDEIYRVMEWKSSESLKLFCLEAFGKTEPPNAGYKSLSETAVKYYGGVPLAIKMLGSYLHSKEMNVWKNTLNRSPNMENKIFFEVCYNGLNDLERNTFLDIAFFFKGKKKDHVIRILDACGFDGTNGIKVLNDKVLISISTSIIQMHDSLQKMGLEIVSKESSEEDHGRRSRLKDNEAHEVIKENKGTNKIEGIILDLSLITDLPLRADTFTKMEALRFLKFHNTSLAQKYCNTYPNLPATLESFSDKLRYIEWTGYPFESLPSSFNAKFLVEIHMRQSKVKELWQEIQELGNLEVIDLSESKQLEKLPDLSEAPKLKWVNLSSCESLCDLNPSVLSSDKLVTLILDWCTKLQTVKGKKHLESLEKISVKGCSNLQEFVVSSNLIENLDLSNTKIQILDTSIGHMKNLKWLNLEGLKLKYFVKELSYLTSLTVLKLSDTWDVIDKQQLHVLFKGLCSLKILHMKDFSNLFDLPDNISDLSKLQELRLDGSNVKNLPESINKLGILEILSLENCNNLQSIPMLPFSIKHLGAINCTSLVTVSNLTWATEMRGMNKLITFKNNLILDGRSRKHIAKILQLAMVHAVFHNERSRQVSTHGYNYSSVQLCLPGSMIPEKIKYQNPKSSITVELPKRSKLLGFIYSVVLSSNGGEKKHGSKIKYTCCFPKKGKKEDTWLDHDIGGLKTDHVYVWYDPFHCDTILRYYEPNVCFEFCVANDDGDVDDSIFIQECGVRIIGILDAKDILQNLKLGKYMESSLVKRVETETGQSIATFLSTESSESSDEEESSTSHSIVEEAKVAGKEEHWKSKEVAAATLNTLRKRKEVESKSTIVKNKFEKTPIQQEIKSEKEPTTIEAKSVLYSSDQEDQTQAKKSQKILDTTTREPSPSSSAFVNVDIETVSELAQEKHPPQDQQPFSDTHENVQEAIAKLEEVFPPTLSLKLQPEVVESSSSSSLELANDTNTKKKPTNDVPNAKSPSRSSEDEHEDAGQEDPERNMNGGESSDLKEIPEVASNHCTTPTPKNLEELNDILNQVETNPFIMLRFPEGASMFSRPSKSSLEQSHAGDDQNFDAALDEFRNLAFTGNLHRNIENPEYKREIEAASKRLADFPQGRTLEIENKVQVFMDLFDRACNFYDSQRKISNQITEIIHEKAADFDKLENAKEQFNKIEETMNNRQRVIEEGKHREAEMEERINKLKEELRKEKKEIGNLEADQQKSADAKNEFSQIAKQVSHNIGKSIMKEIELEATKDQHAKDLKALEHSYQQMQANPPF